jgi:hypothetical protein
MTDHKNEKKMIYSKWYECIEPEVREIVYILRNNGLNTTNSCGHDMWVEVDVSWWELENLYNVLKEAGWSFYLTFYWEGTDLHRSWVHIQLGDKDPNIESIFCLKNKCGSVTP